MKLFKSNNPYKESDKLVDEICGIIPYIEVDCCNYDHLELPAFSIRIEFSYYSETAYGDVQNISLLYEGNEIILSDYGKKRLTKEISESNARFQNHYYSNLRRKSEDRARLAWSRFQ